MLSQNTLKYPHEPVIVTKSETIMNGEQLKNTSAEVSILNSASLYKRYSKILK